MELPNADRAVVERRKIEDYLLNESHPDGAGKAEFFYRFGFRQEQWPVLAQEILRLARSETVSLYLPSRYGHKYILDGVIRTPSGDSAHIRTVWIVDLGKEIPRFVTAYPISPEEESR